MYMQNEKKYFAFISYKEEDYEMAKWLQHKVEHYHIPSIIRKKHPNLPQKIKPVFEYKSEMSGGFLKPAIKQALDESKYLIVICSPNTPQSPWVAGEVQHFIDEGRTNHIIPFVVAGEAYSQNPDLECFPKPLRELKDPLRGISINEMGCDAAAVKVVAQMFELDFDVLWQRYERENKNRRNRIVAASITAFFIMIGVAFWIYTQRQQILEAKSLKSKQIAETVNSLADKDPALAVALAYEVLPDNADKGHSSNLYTTEADFALRKALSYKGGSKSLDVHPIAYFPDREKILAIDGSNLCILNADNLSFIKTIEGYFSDRYKYSISYDCKKIAVYDYRKKFFLVDVETSQIDTIDVESNEVIDEFSLNPTGTRILMKKDNEILLYENHGVLIKRIELPSRVESVSYSPSGKWIIAGCDKGVFVYDSQTKFCVDTLLGHYKDKYGFTKLHNNSRFASDEKTIITYRAGTGCLNLWKWDVDSAKSDSLAVKNCPNDSYINSLSFSLDGNFIVSLSNNNRAIYVWNVMKNVSNPIWSVEKPHKIHLATYDIKENRLVSYYRDDKDNDYVFIDYASTKGLHNVLLNRFFYKYKGVYYNTNNKGTFSPNGNYILVADSDSLFIINAKSGDPINRISSNGKSRANNGFASYSPDGNLIAYASDKTFTVFDSIGKDTLFTKQCYNDIGHVSFSPNSKTVVVLTGSTIGYCDTCFFYDTKTGKVLNVINTKSIGYASEICFNHQATEAVFSGGIKPIYPYAFYRISDRKNSRFVIWYPTPCGRLSFSPDDKYIARLLNDRIEIWETKAWKKAIRVTNRGKLGQLDPYITIKGYYQTLHYDPTGKLLVTTSNNGIHLFDANNGIEIGLLQFGKKATSASFSPDGKKILSLHSDGSICVWDIPPLQDIIDQNRERIKGRPLTLEERHQYHLE